MIADAGSAARRRFIEFFTPNISNRNRRLAYGRAFRQFLTWCEERGFVLDQIEPVHVAAYRETYPGSVATVKQHLAASLQ